MRVSLIVASMVVACNAAVLQSEKRTTIQVVSEKTPADSIKAADVGESPALLNSTGGVATSSTITIGACAANWQTCRSASHIQGSERKDSLCCETSNFKCYEKAAGGYAQCRNKNNNPTGSNNPCPANQGWTCNEIESCVCNGHVRTGDNSGEDNCASTYAGEPYCYVNPQACSDGVASSTETGSDGTQLYWSHAACNNMQATASSTASSTASTTCAAKWGTCRSAASVQGANRIDSKCCQDGFKCYEKSVGGYAQCRNPDRQDICPPDKNWVCNDITTTQGR